MAAPYANTISGLLKRRAELMADARELRERMAVVGNDIAALDRTLETLGYQGEMPAPIGLLSSPAPTCCMLAPLGGRFGFLVAIVFFQECASRLDTLSKPLDERRLQSLALTQLFDCCGCFRPYCY
jgi:hypothetical protein